MDTNQERVIPVFVFFKRIQQTKLLYCILNWESILLRLNFKKPMEFHFKYSLKYILSLITQYHLHILVAKLKDFRIISNSLHLTKLNPNRSLKVKLNDKIKSLFEFNSAKAVLIIFTKKIKPVFATGHPQDTNKICKQAQLSLDKPPISLSYLSFVWFSLPFFEF